MVKHGWNQWQQPWNGQKKDRKEKDKGKGKGAGATSAKPVLPSYDASNASSSASHAKPDAPSSEGLLKAALQEIVTKNQLEVPDQFKSLLQESLNTTLSQDQKALNQKRKLLQRFERLKQARARKQEQRDSFREEIKSHIQKEKMRYEEDIQELDKAIAEAQTAVDKAMNGELEEKSNVETIDLDMEEDLFGTTATSIPKEENTGDQHMAEAFMRETQAGQMMLANQIQEIQKQMTYMAQIFTSPEVFSPSRPAIPGSGVTTPPAVTPEKPRQKRVLAPFARPGQHQKTDGPYGRKEDEAGQDQNLETLDGYGPL